MAEVETLQAGLDPYRKEINLPSLIPINQIRMLDDEMPQAVQDRARRFGQKEGGMVAP